MFEDTFHKYAKSITVKKVHPNKNTWMLPLVEGKRVLDLGCVGHDLANYLRSDWLHGAIKKKAQYVFGVDRLEAETQTLRDKGYNVICANVESMNLGEKFEVAVAGDIIEHLNDLGSFMTSVSKHLTDDGIFVVTTPNPVAFLRFCRILFLGWTGANDEHSCWFTEKVFDQLAKRHGLKLSQIVYIDDPYQYYRTLPFYLLMLSLPFLVLNYFVCRIRPKFCETFGFVLKKRN